MNDKAIITIDCNKNVAQLDDPDLDITKMEYPIKDKRSQLIGMILIQKFPELCEKTISELQDIKLKIIKAI